ncbi:hypothetical protein [Saccharopolyspora hordei]|uniref:Uncharacterized protein YnzC (UPF0291/DUF896 family) n=1 Tax=Saccharopolyspora hordei TaxID=1838 RepID=A0A853AD90_9PSEU|nr:hypothetical protein [Saccharopolyspora hordei]NYI82095.1 uncharacterized protein YnzC (UPF0291/DUF896 family) [Saccharopolyspora hordei]
MSETASVNGRTSIRVDLDRAPELLAELDRVREKYVKARDVATQLATIMPPFGDDVTVEVFKKLGERAQGGEGSLYDSAQGKIDWIDGFKAAVQKALDEHKRIDDENRMA